MAGHRHPLDIPDDYYKSIGQVIVGWNLTEAAVALGAGVFAGSIALIGFGIDSLIESLSGGILLWRLHATDATEKRERLALRLVGVSFFVLAFYVAFEAGRTLQLALRQW